MEEGLFTTLESVVVVVVWGALELVSPLVFVSSSLAISPSSLQPCCPVRCKGGRDLVGLERGVFVMSENTLLSPSIVSGLVPRSEPWEEHGPRSGHSGGGRGGVWTSNKAASMGSNSSVSDMYLAITSRQESGIEASKHHIII